jgi:hypothetical protein
MQDTVEIAAAALVSYVLGRTKKARTAITIALWLTGRRAPSDFARAEVVKLLKSRYVHDLVGELRGQALSAARQAATSVLAGQAGQLRDSPGRGTEHHPESDMGTDENLVEAGVRTAHRLAAARRRTALRQKDFARSGPDGDDDEVSDDYADQEDFDEEYDEDDWDDAVMSQDDDRLELPDRFYGQLLERVRRDRYPSVPMLDLLEEAMFGYEREELFNVLLEKVAADRYPSIMMLKRAARLAG